MKQLALECSGMFGSVAVLIGEKLVEEVPLGTDQRTARTLAPAIDKLLRVVGWQPKEVELISVTHGPGSFTGLRIGVTTAKTFAYATNSALVGLNALQVIAEQTPPTAERLWCVMNAEREQLFAAAFARHDGRWREAAPTCIIDRHSWLALIHVGDLVSGLGLHAGDLHRHLPSGVTAVDESCWQPRAAAVGQLGLGRWQSGDHLDCWSLLPQYFRESAATEKSRRDAASGLDSSR